MAVPDDIATFAQSEAARQGVDPGLVMQVLNTEGGGYNNTSPKGAIGPMQLMPGTAQDLGVDPTDWRQNVTGGVRYLKQQLDTFGGDPKLALAAYNAGPGAVRRYGGVPPYKQTQAYVGDDDTPSAAELFGGGAGGGQASTTPPAAQSGATDPDATPAPQDLFGSRSGRVFVRVRDAQGNPTGQVAPASQAQESYWLRGMSAGQLDTSAPEGSAKNPITVLGQHIPTRPGAYYVTEDGQNGVVGPAMNGQQARPAPGALQGPNTPPAPVRWSDGYNAPDAQQRAYLGMLTSGEMDPNKPMGDPRRPYVYRPDFPPPPGASYIDVDGSRKVMPQAAPQTGANMPIEQAYAISQLQGAGQYDEHKPLGDKLHPIAWQPSDPLPAAGMYYLDQMGKLNRSDGKDTTTNAYNAAMAQKYGQVQWDEANADAARGRTAAETQGPGPGGRAFANGTALSGFPEVMGVPAGWAVDAQNAVARLGLGQPRTYSGDAYRDAIIGGEHQAIDRWAKQHPAANFALGAVGSAPTMEALGAGRFIGGAKTAAGIAARSGVVGGLTGAVTGANQDYTDRVAGAASGGAWGTALGVAAPWATQKVAGVVASAVRPAVNAVSQATGGRIPALAPPVFVPRTPAQQLVQDGVPLTPGQVMGGPAAKAEQAIAKFPGLNFVVGRAQSKAVNGWNIAAGNKVLEPIGATLPNGTQPGRPMLQALSDRIGQEYDNILSKVPGVTRDATFDTDLQNLRNSGQIMFKDDADRLENVIDNGVLRAFDPKTGQLDAQGWKAVDTRLGQMATKTRQTNPEFADGVSALQSSWRDLLERSNPDQAAALDQANTAWGMFKRVQRAALSAGKDEEPGIFTPRQLQQAVIALDKSKDKAAAARGGALMQDFADMSAKVLGNASPMAPGGGGVVGGAMGGLIGAAAGGHAMHVPPPVAAAGGAVASLYTPPVKAAFRAAFGRGVNPQAVATMRGVAPAVAPAVGAIAPRLPWAPPVLPGKRPTLPPNGPIYVPGG